jgi:hypothetical protein
LGWLLSCHFLAAADLPAVAPGRVQLGRRRSRRGTLAFSGTVTGNRAPARRMALATVSR